MPMRKKRHLMQLPRTPGDVFAVEFRPFTWGHCRVIDASGIEVLAIFTKEAGMPDIAWSSPDIERWRFLFWASVSKDDPTTVRTGNAAFLTEMESDMPPMYRDPDNVEPRYTIEYRGMFTYTDDPSQLKGIARQATLTPLTLGSFLKEKYHGGALQEVGVRKSS
jgi:hypothetical protein